MLQAAAGYSQIRAGYIFNFVFVLLYYYYFVDFVDLCARVVNCRTAQTATATKISTTKISTTTPYGTIAIWARAIAVSDTRRGQSGQAAGGAAFCSKPIQLVRRISAFYSIHFYLLIGLLLLLLFYKILNKSSALVALECVTVGTAQRRVGAGC